MNGKEVFVKFLVFVSLTKPNMRVSPCLLLQEFARDECYRFAGSKIPTTFAGKRNGGSNDPDILLVR